MYFQNYRLRQLEGIRQIYVDVSFFLSKISKHAVLADGLDGFLLAIDVIPPGLLQVSTVVRNKLHLHAVLFLILMVRHDGGVRDVNPVVVLAINPTAIHRLVGVSPPKHISVRVPFELRIVAGDNIRWIVAKIGQITTPGPIPVRTSSRVSSGIVQ